MVLEEEGEYEKGLNEHYTYCEAWWQHSEAACRVQQIHDQILGSPCNKCFFVLISCLQQVILHLNKFGSKAAHPNSTFTQLCCQSGNPLDLIKVWVKWFSWLGPPTFPADMLLRILYT